MEPKITLALLGAGNRGASIYADAVSASEGVELVAVAEGDAQRRAEVAARHDLPLERRFASWEELLGEKRLADGLLIALPDRLHLAPALAGLERGYALLLEKPIAPTPDEVKTLLAAARRTSGEVAVAHVLRFSGFFSTLKHLLDEGRIGALVSVQHTENIGYWHFAHSFVRGNWRREDEAAPMILAKACHDLDLLYWLVGRRCERVSSYGGLFHFRPENAPPGSTERCVGGCAVERACPYSALRIYEERFGGEEGWPNRVLTPRPSPQTVRAALHTGPYGRCVYRCDNDVADHQVVNLEFEGGVSASLTVSAFTEANTRTVHLMGTHGELRGGMEGGEIEVNSFVDGTRDILTVPPERGHREADRALVRDFVARLSARRDGRQPDEALTSLEGAAESHWMAFAAERSRRERRSVELRELRM